MKSNPFLKIANSTILCLQKYTNKDTLERQAELHGIVQHLRALKLQELGLGEDQGRTNGVGFRNILEKKGLRVTLYFLPAGQRIELHNHPSMLVISYLIKGKLQAQLYSPTVNPGLFHKETIIIQGGSISYIDGLRANTRNLHEFTALQDTYFVDILFPDYDEKRECVFYQEQEMVSENCAKLRPIEPNQLQFFQI